MRVTTERDAMYYIKTSQNAVYYVIRYWSPTCEICVKSDPAFMKLVQAFPDVIFFTLEVKNLQEPKYFSLVRATPSFAIGTKFSGQVSFIEGADLQSVADAIAKRNSF